VGEDEAHGARGRSMTRWGLEHGLAMDEEEEALSQRSLGSIVPDGSFERGRQHNGLASPVGGCPQLSSANGPALRYEQVGAGDECRAGSEASHMAFWCTA